MAKASIIPIFIPHAGCPHDCVFCNQRSISGAATPPCPAEVDDMIKAGLNHANDGAELAFYGGSFTSLPVAQQEDYLMVAQAYLESGRIAKIRVSTRPDSIDDNTLDRLAAYGVKTVELGAQSFDNEVLKRAGRGHDAQTTMRASALVKQHGLDLVLQLMPGLPKDTDDGFLKSCETAIQLMPDAVRLYPVVVLRGTALHRLWSDHLYTPPDVQCAVTLCARSLELFIDARIPVIRIGLNPSKELSGGEAVAGAYHPAFGELVWSKLYLTRITAQIIAGAEGRDIKIYVHKKRASIAAGQHGCNLARIKEQYNPHSIKILPILEDIEDIYVKIVDRTNK